MNFGLQEFIIIFVIVLVLFGGKRIPEMIKNFGSSIKQFKSGMQDEIDKDVDKE